MGFYDLTALPAADDLIVHYCFFALLQVFPWFTSLTAGEKIVKEGSLINNLVAAFIVYSTCVP